MKERPIGDVFAMAHMPTSNITRRSIRRWREANSQLIGGKFEDPELQDRIQKMSGWERHQWARAGQPTEREKIAEVLLRATINWQWYRRGQRMARSMKFEFERLGGSFMAMKDSFDRGRVTLDAFEQAWDHASLGETTGFTSSDGPQRI